MCSAADWAVARTGSTAMVSTAAALQTRRGVARDMNIERLQNGGEQPAGDEEAAGTGRRAPAETGGARRPVYGYPGDGSMLALRLIERKRDGGRIEAGEWRALANAYATGHVPDYQMAAFLMACFLRGMDRGETAALTEAMLRSGDTLDLAYLNRARVD